MFRLAGRLSSALLVSLALGPTVAAAAPRTAPAVVRLAGITNDRDTSVSRLGLVLGARDEVRGIAVVTGPPDARHASATRRVYPLRRIESPQGVVLGQGRGVRAILLRGRIDSRAGRGTLVIRYLTNGLLMSYRQCRIGLERDGPRRWRLVNAYSGATIRSIRVRTWMLGISTLEPVCPGPQRPTTGHDQADRATPATANAREASAPAPSRTAAPTT